LTEFKGHNVQVRFRFCSDGAVGKEGWLIDDVSLTMPMTLEPPQNFNAELASTGVLMTWEPPVPLRDDYLPNELLGYAVYRGIDDLVKVDTLITENSFLLNLMNAKEGGYMFVASAVYKDGESIPSNLVELKWEKPVEEGVTVETEAAPSKYEITASYPNPFNGFSRISYSVPQYGEINLSVYDQNGRLVSTLVSGARNPGRYSTVFDGSHLASGVYLVRMSTPEGMHSSKLVLIK
jgi:hypothetical protein